MGYPPTDRALTSPPDFLNTREAEGAGRGDRAEGDSVVLERCWQPSLRTCINCFLASFQLSVLARACVCPHTQHFNHCLASIKHKGKEEVQCCKQSIYFPSSEF